MGEHRKVSAKARERVKKAGAGGSCLFMCGESVLPEGVLNSCRLRAFGARCSVSQMTLRTVCVSPPSHQFRNWPCQTLRAVIPGSGSRYSGVGSIVSRPRKNGGNAHGAISITGRARALPINEILCQCCSHHLTISSTHQQGGSPTPVEAIL